MNVKVNFNEINDKFPAKFDSVTVVTGTGYEDGYAAGYEKGEQIGKEEGYKEGEASGVEKAKKLLTALSATKNGEYLPQGENIGFKSVSVNVDTSEAYQEGFSKGLVDGYNNALANLATLTATANGEYTPPSGKIGFKKVSVAVPSDAKTEQEKSKTITENGTYEILPDSGKALSKVTVTASIPERKEEQEKTASVTSNGSVVVLPDTGKVLSKVTLNVAVPERVPVLQDKEITENGTYTAGEGYDGFGTIIVNVPQTGGGETETKWLFKDVYIIGENYELPPLVVGVSYTCFVDGEEIATVLVDDYAWPQFTNGDVIVEYNVYDPGTEDEFWAWSFGDGSTVQSGTVSIRINEEQSGGGGSAEETWLFEDEEITEGERYDLPLPVQGTSYTAFVDGVEIGTATAGEWNVMFIAFDGKLKLVGDLDIGYWCFTRDDLSATEGIYSGTVSIKINER